MDDEVDDIFISECFDLVIVIVLRDDSDIVFVFMFIWVVYCCRCLFGDSDIIVFYCYCEFVVGYIGYVNMEK